VPQFFIGAVLGLLTIIGCTSDQNIQSTTLVLQPTSIVQPRLEPTKQPTAAMTNNILYDWLQGIPCHPPCWQGITPGQTLASDAKGTLQKKHSISNMEVLTTTRHGVLEGAIYWELDASQGEGGTISFKGDPSTVQKILVDPDGPLTLQNVIDVYGQPSHVHATATPCVDHDCTVYWLDILFVEHGFALSVETIPKGTSPDFGPDWRNFYVMFFEPTLEGFAAAWGNPAVVEALTPWRGMLGFDDYCVGSRCN
jgi:hypothetical protein